MKKKLALSTTAIAVLASTVPTHVAPVEAEETGKIIYTQFDSGVGNNVSQGDGTSGNPFNLFKDALAKAQKGDTIVIVGKGFINDDGSTGLPFYIDKEVTIKAGESGTHLEVNAGGIVLGADVTFENIQLNFANGYHDAIFANGHTLNLKNVTRYEGAREIDLFAGGLYTLGESTPLYEAGSHGVINIYTDRTLDGNSPKSVFGNIYAGSMNGAFSGDAEITLTRHDKSKNLTVKGIYGSGALEAKVPEDWFGQVEPEPPAPMPEQFKMSGNINITLNDYQLPIDGTTGTDTKTSLTVNAENFDTYKLKNIDTLNLTKGTIELKPLTDADTLTGIPNLNLATGTILDLTKLTGDFDVNEYTGRGGVVLPTSGRTMNIEQAVDTEHSLTLYIEGYNLFNYNGRVTPGQTYVTTANGDAPITYFDIHYLDEDYEYTPVSNGVGYDWKVVNPIKVTGFSVTENTKIFSTSKFTTDSHPAIEYTFNALTNVGLNSELWLDEFISKLKVNGHTAERKSDGGDVWYRVEDLNMTIRFEPASETDFKLQKMVVEFKDTNGNLVTPQATKYDFEISVDGINPLKLTLDIQAEVKPDPTEPDGDEGDEGEPEKPKLKHFLFVEGPFKDDYNYRDLNYGDDEDTNSLIKIPFYPSFTEVEGVTPEDVNLENYNLVYGIGEKEAQYRPQFNDYYVEEYGVSLAPVKVGENSFELHVKGSDKSGNKAPLPVMNDEILIKQPDLGMTTGQIITVYKEVGDEYPYPLTYEFTESNEKSITANHPNRTVRFGMDIKYVDSSLGDTAISEFGPYFPELTINGQKVEYDITFNGYLVEDLGLWQIERLPNQSYALQFTSIEEESSEIYFKEGTHTVEGTDRYGVKIEATLNITKEEEEQPPSGGGGSSSGGSTGGGGPSVDGGTPTTPPTGGGTVTPPSTGGSSTGGGTTTTPPSTEGGVTPPTTDKEEPTPKPPVVEDKVNGVENLKDLDKELQQKVDSIIADTLVQENGLSLNLKGDKDDLTNVSTLEVTKDGLFINVEGDKVKFNTSLDLDDIDWDNTRVIRMNESGDGFSAVPHKNIGDGLKIFSSSFANLLITPKVEEPFEDVSDQDWFKSDVEEMYNYGFTTGTTATTYSPNESITRAQFAVMLARAFELTSNNESKGLSDLKGKWYQDEAQALFEAGIIKGFANGTFGGEEKLTRQQAVTMIVNMLKYKGVKTEVADDIQFADLDKIGEHAQDAVKYLASQDVLVNGEGVNFNPYNNLTRAQMAKMLLRSLRLTDLY